MEVLCLVALADGTITDERLNLLTGMWNMKIHTQSLEVLLNPFMSHIMNNCQYGRKY